MSVAVSPPAVLSSPLAPTPAVLSSSLPPAAGVTSPPVPAAAAAAALLSSPLATTPASSVITVPPQPTFMSSWETANIDWDNYDLNDTVSVGKIISDFQGLNSKHLVGNIENNSILQLTPKKFTTAYIAASGVDQSDFNIIEFFDYTKTFKDKIATDVNKNNSFLTRRTDRDTSLLKQLGYLMPNGRISVPVKVVSLLTRGKELVGICYSICTDRSDIDRSLGLRRLICAKKSGVVDVQIWFFPEHPLGYQFYQGKVIFDDKGLYKGLKEGILLIKKNGIYEVVHGNFIGDAVDGNSDNKLYQYSYDAPAAAAAAAAAALAAAAAAPASPAAVNLLKLEGYADGKIGWNLGKPFPIDMVDITGVTCLNWNFGKVVVDKFIDDDDLSTCVKMYYTTHHNGLDTPHIEGLLNNAASPQIPTISVDKRKIDFIKKEDYVDIVEPLMLRKTFIAPDKDRFLDAFLDLDTRFSQQNLEPDEDRESERLDKMLGSDLT